MPILMIPAEPVVTAATLFPTVWRLGNPDGYTLIMAALWLCYIYMHPEKYSRNPQE